MAASFALSKSAGGLRVYWSGEWCDRYGLDPVYVNLSVPPDGEAVARFEFKHLNATGTGYDTTRSAEIASTVRGQHRAQVPGITTTRPLWAVRVHFRRDDAPGWCTKWIYNPYF